MPLIRQYITREILGTLFATLTILLAILLVQRLALYLNEAATGGLTSRVILSLLGIQLLRFLTELLPLGFLIACILAFGRLYKDSEMTAMYALGVPLKTLYKTLLNIAIPISILLILLNFWIVPETSQLEGTIQKQAREEAQLTIIKAGTFRELAKGRHVVYVKNISENGRQINDVFVKTFEKNNEYSITIAENGHQLIDPESQTRYLILNNGTRFNVTNTEHDMLYFKTIHLRLDSDNTYTTPRPRTLSMTYILNNFLPDTGAEFHRRIAAPISLFIILIMLPALAHSKPRDGRFNRILLAIIIYVVYFNLIGIGQAWIKNKFIPVHLGLWWVHIIMLIFALFIAHRHSKSL